MSTKQAAEMDSILIVDGHLDLAYNALFNRRDLTQPIQVLRERQGGIRTGLSSHPDSLERCKGPELVNPGTPVVSLPELRAGNIGIIVYTVMCRVHAPGQKLDNAVRTQAAAYAVGQYHLALYRAWEHRKEIVLIKNNIDLDNCVAAWKDPGSQTPVGVILSMESVDPIMDPDQVMQSCRLFSFNLCLDNGVHLNFFYQYMRNCWGEHLSCE